MIGPIHAAGLQIFAKRLNRAQKFSLLDGERADREVDGGALLQQKQRFEHGDRIFSAGKGDGHAIAIADHLEARDGLAHLAQQSFFEFQITIIGG